MAVINPKSMANLVISPEKRRENQKKASITRRENKEKLFKELHEKEVALGLTELSSSHAGIVLNVSARQVQHMRRYIKTREA